MKVIVFGATGLAGRHVVEQALAAGHEVTAVARKAYNQVRSHSTLAYVRPAEFERNAQAIKTAA